MAKEPQILEPELQRGVIAGGEDPVVSAYRLAAYEYPDEFGGGRAANLHAAVVERYAQELRAEKAEVQRLRDRNDSLRESLTLCREAKAKQDGKVESMEAPWAERARQIVGGGFMGASFKIYDFHWGLAAFIFILGLVLSIASIIPALIAAWRRQGGEE